MRYLSEMDQFIETWSEYIPFIITPGSDRSRFAASFKVPFEYVPDALKDEWKMRHGGEEVPVTFTVTVSGAKKSASRPITSSIEDIFNVSPSHEAIQFTHTSEASVVYSNDISGMRQGNFQDNVVFFIYATVVKIVKTYALKFHPDVIRFSAAHEGLQPIYHVMCMKAEKSFGYKYGNPRRGRENHGFILISPEIVAKLKNYFAQKAAQPSAQGVTA